MPSEYAVLRKRWGFRLLGGLLIVLLTACNSNEDQAADLADALEIADSNVNAITLGSTENKLTFSTGESWQLIASGNRLNAPPLDVSDSVNWQSSRPDLIAVDDRGEINTTESFEGVETVTIRAVYGPYEAAIDLQISSAELISLAVEADPSGTMNECLEATLQVSGTFEDGSIRPVEAENWSLSPPGIAAVTDDTLFSLRSGVVSLVASRDGVESAPYPQTMTDTLTAISVERGTEFSVRRGSTVNLVALGNFSDGTLDEPLTQTARWSTDSPSVLTLTETGQLTATRAGTAGVTAECGGLSATSQVTVIDVSGIVIEIDDEDPVSAGEERQLSLFEQFGSENQKGNRNLFDTDERLAIEIDPGEEIVRLLDDGTLVFAENFSSYPQNFVRIRITYLEFQDEIQIFLEETAP